MSKLVGIVNPNADPADYFNHWLWRATEIPWEYEQLTIEKMAVEGGNVQIRVIGPHTARYPDGVFLRLHINAELNPEIRVSGEPLEPWIEPPEGLLLNPPNPYSAETAKVREVFAQDGPKPSQKEQLLLQIASLLETLKAMS